MADELMQRLDTASGQQEISGEREYGDEENTESEIEDDAD